MTVRASYLCGCGNLVWITLRGVESLAIIQHVQCHNCFGTMNVDQAFEYPDAG